MMTLILLGSLAFAGDKFVECKVSVGEIQSCSGGYTGTVITEYNGSYRTCKVTGGFLGTCGGSYTGKAVVYRGPKYQMCDISAGKVFSCAGTGHNGTAVIRR
jgi:hypothetical protein